MIALKEANYLGQVEYLSQNSGLITSITSYPDLAHAENLHYHDTLHLSIVLKGGNLEKRKKDDIERLPGTVTYYDAGELHRSTRIQPASRHLNMEILDDFLSRHGLNSDATGLSGKRSIQDTFLLLQLYREVLYPDNDSLLNSEAITLELLGHVQEKRTWANEPSWVSRVREFLQDHWNVGSPGTELEFAL